jgi:hypothetical protein
MNVLRVIGSDIFRLELTKMRAEDIEDIVEYCPNIQYLDLKVVPEDDDDGSDIDPEDIDEESFELISQKTKKGLKKLASLRVNYASVRLGSEWMDY